ncbi:type II secretion system minor pseudopilin GspI [Candidatus Thiothrix anitrata]|jgi:general secretion pathway protein I|uniref:Type II secretion system protein I n=1 Tax=Candidatus Thiothrix anitrata TaxID=2823902 RepID=A0ABX7X3V9_9GAMM|nr:type II secretion system minor pseudopilin GspI [Candidatus Thiothrix anitrata]QTR50559.1 type II secretion system minor pseudopilin GspI [Candidatus Thiothrix anitrata]
MRVSARQQGFNLIEVLIALLLLGVVISVSVETSMGDIALYKRHLDSTLARWVALNRIAEVQLQGVYPQEGSTKGEVDMGNSRWQWQQEIVATPNKDLRRIVVSVFALTKPDERVDIQVGYIANPQPAPLPKRPAP